MSSSARASMVPVSRRVRAYFAPVERNTETPAIFDPAKHGAFELELPPSPWVDLGWIDNFERSSQSTLGVLNGGAPSVEFQQYRSSLAARVEFDFREWGKLQMALAGGVQHMNVLAVTSDATLHPSGGNPVPAVAILSGSTASELVFGPGAVDAFNPGDILVVDVDYQQQVGYVGTGIAAAYVRDPAAVKQDPNYTRRVSFNVGRIAEKTTTSVILTQPLIGGAPPSGAAAQRVVAFLDREGGSFFQEWAALFVMQEESGGRICFYYPRLTPSSPQSAAKGFAREPLVEIAKPIHAVALHTSFVALPYVDSNDGELVLCYRSYFPDAAAVIY